LIVAIQLEGSKAANRGVSGSDTRCTYGTPTSASSWLTSASSAASRSSGVMPVFITP
jgi:hypothetical protein